MHGYTTSNAQNIMLGDGQQMVQSFMIAHELGMARLCVWRLIAATVLLALFTTPCAYSILIAYNPARSPRAQGLSHTDTAAKYGQKSRKDLASRRRSSTPRGIISTSIANSSIL